MCSFLMRQSLLVVALMSTSCSSAPSACEMDSMFCHPPEEWLGELPRMSEERLLHLNAISFARTHPPYSAFQEELGKRGEKAIGPLIRQISHDDELSRHTYFLPILGRLREESNLDICRTPYLGAFERAVSENDVPAWRKEENLQSLTEFCS